MVDEAPTQVSLPAPGLGPRQHGWTLSAFTTVKDRCHLWTAAGIAAHMLQSKKDVVSLTTWFLYIRCFMGETAQSPSSGSMKNVIIEY